MTSRWHRKRNAEREFQEEAAVQNMDYDTSSRVKDQTTDAAMGGGDKELFEKKLSKEEKKALAKKKREEKKMKSDKNKSKKGDGDDGDGDGGGRSSVAAEADRALRDATEGLSAVDLKDKSTSNAAADELATRGTICTFSTSRKGIDDRSRDVNVQNFTLQHKGTVMLDETQIVLNHGNRYGLMGRNGCGKSTLMKALAARAVPIPENIDVYHLSEEMEASDTVTALEAVMTVDEERETLEREAEKLNVVMSKLAEQDGGGGDDENDGDVGGGLSIEEQQEKVMDMINYVYERLDLMDASTAEMRAREILRGLGFTHDMQGKVTGSFSGGWRMRVSLARALFIQPTLLLLDEPTNHLDMEAVVWVEDYLSRWDKILLLISHSQDFLNNVTSHTIHLTAKRKLEYYDGNYDQFQKTKTEKEENQQKQFTWEQDQIKSMNSFIARFGHGTSKNAKQAQSKQKVLDKMVRGGLTSKPEPERLLNFQFPDPGHLPPPVLAFHDVSFSYPNCQSLYTDVSFGVDLDSRVALVGPNGAGKTTLVKLMTGELLPTSGDIRPHGHLKMGRFTQHFVDVLDLNSTPLEYFDSLYPGTPYEDQRKYLGRFGVSGKMQVQRMEELSDGQKSRVVFAKLGRESPHILLLDEPTNHLDMESIDALAMAVNDFKGGLVLVSHDMRLISQVAKEIWICDERTIRPYRGDITSFKMDMRAQMGIANDGGGGGANDKKKKQLKGDASVSVKKKKEVVKKVVDNSAQKKKPVIATVSALPTPVAKVKAPPKYEPRRAVVSTTTNGGGITAGDNWDDEDDDTPTLSRATAGGYATSSATATKTTVAATSTSSSTKGRYVPPHLRKR